MLQKEQILPSCPETYSVRFYTVFLLNCKFHINEKKIVHTNLRLDPTWQKEEKQAGSRNRRKWLIISAKET